MLKIVVVLILTTDNNVVFSRNAPIQPVKPIINVNVPIHINKNAGSNAIFVNFDKLLNISFSFHAQIPMAKMHKPNNCKIVNNNY